MIEVVLSQGVAADLAAFDYGPAVLWVELDGAAVVGQGLIMTAGLDPSMLRFLQMSQLWAAACLPALPFQSAPIGGYARNSNLAGSHATWSGSL